MATLDELSERLHRRFKDVPNVGREDTDEWMETALNEHGYTGQSTVPVEMIPLILLYAEADGVGQVALRVAYYFQYSDRDETVDKTKVADNYRRLAETLWDRYKVRKAEGVGGFGGSRFAIMTRADRP